MSTLNQLLNVLGVAVEKTLMYYVTIVILYIFV